LAGLIEQQHHACPTHLAIITAIEDPPANGTVLARDFAAEDAERWHASPRTWSRRVTGR